jgi:putative lipoprotein
MRLTAMMALAGVLVLGGCGQSNPSVPNKNDAKPADAKPDPTASSATAPAGEKKILKGSVGYMQRIAMPPHAVVLVQLQDVTKVDAPSVILAEQTIPNAGNPPYKFELAYDAAAIKPDGKYGLYAKISVDGQQRFVTTEFVPAIVNGKPVEPLDVVLKMVPESKPETK